MFTPLRTTLVLAAGLGSLFGLSAFDPAAGEATSPPVAAEWGALNYWVSSYDPADHATARQHTLEVVDHLREAHPEIRVTAYRLWPGKPEMHFLMESVNTRASLTAQDSFTDEVCRAQLAVERELFEQRGDTDLRLISSNPEKEERLGPRGNVVIHTLQARRPMVGRALEVARELTEHLNETFDEATFRSYQEWQPTAGRIHLHFYGTGVAPTEDLLARMHADPGVRRILESSADAFLEGSFEDTWLNLLAR